MDITEHLKAKSDQLNADDLVGGPITVQITDVSRGDAEQPVVVRISGGHCPWKPCKSMLRLLANAWGLDTREWHGRWLTLYRDPTVMWAGQPVGGVRVKAMSHLDDPQVTIRLAVTRGKKALFSVDRLDAPKETGTPTAKLKELMQENGISEAAIDAYLGQNNRPALADLNADQRAKLAAHIAGNDRLIEQLKQ